ncbi:MAG: cohesin domain-containing protein [Anaerolineae bacterium]
MTWFTKVIMGLWFSWLACLLAWPAQAGEPIRLSLQNLPLQDDRLLVVTVQLEHVSDLYGAQIRLKYDPTHLRVLDEDPRIEGVQIAPGPLLYFDDRFVAVNSADSATGLIDFVVTLLNPAPPISGQGILATVRFEMVGSGPFEVQVEEAKLVSSQLTAVAVNATGLRLDQPGAAATPLGSGWWLGVAAAALVLALVPLFWLLSRRAAVPTPAGQSAGRRMPGLAHNSTRTAALLTEQGQRAMAQGDLPQAYDRFSQAIELDPANVAAWLGKGQVAGQSSEKRICFQRVLALDPHHVQAQIELQQLEATEGLLKR